MSVKYLYSKILHSKKFLTFINYFPLNNKWNVKKNANKVQVGGYC